MSRSQEKAVRDALVGLLSTVHHDLVWSTDQPYKELVYRSIANAYHALGFKPEIGVGADLRAAIDEYFEAAERGKNGKA